MSLAFRRLRQLSIFSPHVSTRNSFRQAKSFTVPPWTSLPRSGDPKFVKTSSFHPCRYSTISQAPNVSSSPPTVVDEIMGFVENAFDQFEGKNHCWLNTIEENKDFFRKDGAILVIAGQLLENNAKIVSTLENAKSLQQRFSWLRVMALHCGSSTCPATDKARLCELLMKEYITFPILLCHPKLLEMDDGTCCILFKDFKSPLTFHETGLDLGVLNKAVEELHVQENKNINDENSSLHKSTWAKEPEAIKEPYMCSYLQNLLLCFPDCVSADESGDRLFISDSNHHRIIVLDDNGKILDCIGSSPGFEDGQFESAKLTRPAASFYDDAEDCLYIVDSENHAIRRADMEQRVLETVYPTCSVTKKNKTVWTWIVVKLGLGNNIDAHIDLKSEDFDPHSLVFPWHLLKLEDDSFLVINRSFDSLWVIDFASGERKEFIKGFPKILETYGQLLMEKVSLLKQMPSDLLQKQTDANCSLEGLPYVTLISSITAFQDKLVAVDTVAQRVLKVSRESGYCSNFTFSNFGILGLPYWLSLPLERVYSVAGAWTDHTQAFSLLPGRIDIRLNVDIPAETELVETLQEGCIWRQTRGAATEVLGTGGIVGTSEKVGAAQQWYDDLDNLAFSTAETEVIVEDDNSTPTNLKPLDDKVHIDCVVNSSPGTSEVIISAALYLKLKRRSDVQEGTREKYAAMVADIMNPGRGGGGTWRESCIRHLLKSGSDLGDLIFVRPLHVRIRLDCPNHPKADNGKDFILTDASIEVNVALV